MQLSDVQLTQEVACMCPVHSNQCHELQMQSTREILCLLEYFSDHMLILQQPDLFICCPCARLVEALRNKIAHSLDD